MKFKICFCMCLSYVYGHSYLTTPITRSNQRVTRTGCRGPQCLGPCDAPLSGIGQTPVVKIKRGDSIELIWPRNNHAGGFIRVAWAPTADSDQHESFSKNVQLWTCHEMTCKSSSPSDPLGGDSDGDAVGKCTTSVNVPPQLDDGKFTLQWTWIGGAFALGDYYSCVDYEIEGGSEHVVGNIEPEFKGGDVHVSNENKCLFFNTNDVGICVNEPCTTGNMPGKQIGTPKGFESSSAKSEPKSEPPKEPKATTTIKAEETIEEKRDSAVAKEKRDIAVAKEKKEENVSISRDNIRISYNQTNFPEGHFEGLLDISNRGDTSSWSVSINLPETAKIEKVVNAKFSKTSPGTFEIFSMSPIPKNSDQQVLIEGTL